jgi:nicotinamide-nucleotide adenylyltransferase
MNELSQFLVESILGEADSVDNKVVVYSGRFQPFHKGHYATYQHLVKKFGKDNVYIGTSNKTDNDKSPFNFKEKVMIITKMFGIPQNKIVQVKNPYAPKEVLNKFDKDTTAFITVVGKKDASRLGGKYFTPYKDNLDFEGYEGKGYVYIAPQQSNPISGTEVRKGLSSGSDEDKKDFFTKRAYPKFDKKVFDFITNTLNEEFTIPKEVVENWLVQNLDLIKEASSTMGKTAVDDGPNFLFPSYSTFDKVSQKRAEEIGYSVLSQIMSDELTDIDPHPIYPDGPVKAVTPYPAGVAGKTTATNQKDFYGSNAYNKWFKHVTRVAGLVGYSLVDFIDIKNDREESLKDLNKEKGEVGKSLHETYKTTNIDTTINCEKCSHSWEIDINDNEKYLCHNCGFDNQSKQYNLPALEQWKKSQNINEDINLPVNVGDTILTGRFKNKKTVVKSIGKDEYGMPTINGRKVVNFRILKEGTINEIPMADLVKIDQYADKQLNPVDVVLTDKHFFDRLTDPRNKKPISSAELIGFFKRLGKKKKEFVNFLNLYGQIVAKDNRSKINIPFMKQANKVIAKTVMRKDDFKTSSPEYKFEQLAKGMDIYDIANMHKVDIDDLDKELQMGINVEMEHTSDKSVAEKIALDHLYEDPKYYTKLSTIEDVNENNNSFNDFAKGRGDGAGKISNNAKEKGGDSLLTHHHFDVKLPYYEKASRGEFDLEQAKKEFKDTHQKINFNMEDVDFQEEMGRLEVLGELIIKYSSLKEYVMFKSNIQSTPPKKGLGDENIEEVTPHGYPDQKWLDDHEKELKRLRNKFDKEKVNERADYKYITQVILDAKPKYNVYYNSSHNVVNIGGVGYDKGDLVKNFNQKPGSSTKIKNNFFHANKDPQKTKREVEKLSNGKIKVTFGKGYGNEPIVYYSLKESVNESLIMEGGAYGHMNHPFDTEINLTFGQLKDIVQKALEGNLELTREKTDGQALAVSWRDGRLVAARNKGHLKNKGENALDINGVATKFAGRGELEKAYNFAMKDLTQAISKLSEKQREKIFKGGACFMNLEVIYPTSVNVIPYGQALLVFHGTMEYNEEGIAIGENQEAAKILAGMIKQVNADVQSAYTIQGPPINELPKSKDLAKLKGKYNSQISKLQSKFKLKDTDGIADYHQAFWMDFVTKKSPTKLDNRTLMGLVKRWAFYDKSFRLDKKNLPDEKTLEWAKGIDKNDHAKMAKDNIRPFEDIFLGIGADILSFMSSVLAANPDKAVRDMKKRLDQTIKDVRKSGDPKKIAKLKLELERLNAIGGKDKIVPNEGIVFVYGGKTFKLTGTFAPLNQILGLFYE